MSVNQKPAGILAESRKRAEAALKRRKGGSFLQDVKEELKKVSWTSKEELKLCTKVVLSSIFAFGFAIYAVDLLFKGALELISDLFHRIAG